MRLHRLRWWRASFLVFALACAEIPTTTTPLEPPPRIAASVGGAIYTFLPDGGDPLLVSPRGFDPSWSPDGQQLVFTYLAPGGLLSTSEIRIVNADGSREHTILGPGINFAPDWSPDGRSIALVLGEADGTRSIATISPEGTNLIRVRGYLALADTPAWSPDGTRLAFVSNCHDPCANRFVSDLWVVNRDGSGATKLTAGVEIDDDVWNPTWSPDGAWIVFGMKREHQSNIYRTQGGGATLEQLTSGPWGDGTFVSFFGPTYSPDGARLAYIVEGAVANFVTSLVISNPDGSDSHQVALSIGSPSAIDWAR